MTNGIWFSGIEGNISKYTQIFGNFLPEISTDSIWFSPRISEIFGWMVRFSKYIFSKRTLHTVRLPRLKFELTNQDPAGRKISSVLNWPFAGSGHMVRNKLHWDANDAVGLSKQKNSYQSSPTFLCFESPTASFASQCNLFRTMWLDPAKGLFNVKRHLHCLRRKCFLRLVPGLFMLPRRVCGIVCRLSCEIFNHYVVLNKNLRPTFFGQARTFLLIIYLLIYFIN